MLCNILYNNKCIESSIDLVIILALKKQVHVFGCTKAKQSNPPNMHVINLKFSR